VKKGAIYNHQIMFTFLFCVLSIYYRMWDSNPAFLCVFCILYRD